jgi:uncharacterized protein DUF6766
MRTQHNTFKRHGFAYVMGALFAVTLSLHLVFAYLSSETSEERFDFTFLRDMFENWQSEMLQLLLQVVLLAYLWYIGSPQSREGNERIEQKLDWLGNEINPLSYQKLNEELNSKYPRK